MVNLMLQPRHTSELESGCQTAQALSPPSVGVAVVEVDELALLRSIIMLLLSVRRAIELEDTVCVRRDKSEDDVEGDEEAEEEADAEDDDEGIESVRLIEELLLGDPK
jgi:hypothetical protein